MKARARKQTRPEQKLLRSPLLSGESADCRGENNGQNGDNRSQQEKRACRGGIGGSAEKFADAARVGGQKQHAPEEADQASEDAMRHEIGGYRLCWLFLFH